MDILGRIIERKRRENRRRRRHVQFRAKRAGTTEPIRLPRPGGVAAVRALRRPAGQPLRVISEIKLRSPSAGVIRGRRKGIVAEVASAYERSGASAISVLCDGPGFGGSPLDLRRAAQSVRTPLLFKEFVLESEQLRLADQMGASLVLLLVNALSQTELDALVAEAHLLGLAPVVEAANATELERALSTGAEIVGVNARDLRTFKVDPARAQSLVARIPSDRVAVHMSGIKTRDDMARVAGSRADAVLIGETLMRATDPGAELARLRAYCG